MNFGEIFGKSWKIVWKHKILWLFGIFAGLLSGGGNGSSGVGDRGGINYTFQDGEFQEMFPWISRFGYNIEHFFSNVNEGAWVGFAVALACFALFWFVLSIFLGNVGKAALIKGVLHAEEDSNAKLKFGALFKEGLGYFWQMLVLQLLTIGIVIGAVIIGIVFSIVTLGIGAILLICLAIPIAVGAGLLLTQTNIFIVAENMNVIDAIKASWEFVFEKNLGNYLLMFLIVGVGSWIVGFVLAIPIFMLLVPIGMGVFLSEGAMLGVGLLIGLGIFFALYIPIAILVNGILTAFVQAVWTLTYCELRFKPTEEELTPLELQASLPGDGEMV
ncbi:MAG: hypothetical protein KAH23_08730 [Kiritimatiellae bacterium]|nr:hypothetical protein [Kiritimatiellia bacterium]